MGWFSKKKEEKGPDLPELPELPETPNSSNLAAPPVERTTRPEPPAVPEIEVKDIQSLPEPTPQRSGEDIKREIENPTPEPMEDEEPEIEEEEAPVIADRSRIMDDEPEGYIKSSFKKTEPVYIRLDKFQSTVETFENIKDKVQEIEKLLAKTKEIRAKEERELEEWEKEIHLIKTKIESIDKSILNKLD